MARSQQPLSGKEAAKNSESREKIIRAAFKEFGEHGYEGASTNQICLAAGISKGLLYHYFGSKEKLFLSVCDCCIRDIEEELIGLMEGRTAVDLNALSIFYRKQADFFLEHPNHYHILSQIVNSSSESIAAYAEEKNNRYREQASIALRLFLSRSPIRSGVDKELALELMLKIVENLQRRYMDSIRQQHISMQLAQQLMEHQLMASMDIVLHWILDSDQRKGLAENEL